MDADMRRDRAAGRFITRKPGACKLRFIHLNAKIVINSCYWKASWILELFCSSVVCFLIPADLEALMRSLNIGPEEEDEHDHHMDEHADHDHSGLRLRKRSSHEHHMGHERNTTWDQVCKYRLKKRRKKNLTKMSHS